jgi:hypothetical protein
MVCEVFEAVTVRVFVLQVAVVMLPLTMRPTLLQMVAGVVLPGGVSVKFTVPPRSTVPEGVGVIVAVNVTWAPTVDGVPDVPTETLVEPCATYCVIVLLLPVKLESLPYTALMLCVPAIIPVSVQGAIPNEFGETPLLPPQLEIGVLLSVKTTVPVSFPLPEGFSVIEAVNVTGVALFTVGALVQVLLVQGDEEARASEVDAVVTDCVRVLELLLPVKLVSLA